MSGVFSFYDLDDNLINDESPVSLGSFKKGSVHHLFSAWIWNDRGGSYGAGTADEVIVFAVKAGQDCDCMFTGTPFNKFRSMLEARSANGINIPGRWDTEWHEVSPVKSISIGKMIPNSARLVEFRLSIPYDAVLFDEAIFSLRVYGS